MLCFVFHKNSVYKVHALLAFGFIIGFCCVLSVFFSFSGFVGILVSLFTAAS